MTITIRRSPSRWASAALALILLAASAIAPKDGYAQTREQARWRTEAQASTIIRDDFGIAHVHGKTDADAVFAMVYAQAEDDFNRVETNYINALGRLAEAEGEGAVYQDLREKLFIDPVDLQAKYAASPAWLQRLMDAWAEGLNTRRQSSVKSTKRPLKPKITAMP